MRRPAARVQVQTRDFHTQNFIIGGDLSKGKFRPFPWRRIGLRVDRSPFPAAM
jgi:hypothetical protein